MMGANYLINRFFLSGLIVFFASAGVQAQLIPEQAGADSIRNAFLPVVSFSSDIGLFGGAIYNRYDYSGDIRPFKSYLQSSAVVSTRGYIKAEGLYEQTRTFTRDIRSTYKAFFYRFAKDNYFGIGNNTSYNDQLWEEEYYYFESISGGLDIKLRRSIYAKRDSRLDLLGGAGIEYHIPYVRQPNSSFSERTPNGSEGGFVNYLTAGFFWENRNREFDPQTGNRGLFEARYAPALLSEYALTAFLLDFRQYFYLFDFLTVANRLEGRHAAGDVPYWELPVLGDHYSLRGYPLNRFMGNSSIAFNFELRSWMFTFPEYQLKLGVQLFTDVGRVFTREDNVSDLFKDYKQTFGFGGAMSLFSPDFLLRGEMGFSKHVSRIYIGLGYAF